jgi:arabinan endo-1,5-alpha-L-arabinosidase
MHKGTERRRLPRHTIMFVLSSVLMLAAFAMPRTAPAQTTTPGTYTNPLPVTAPGIGNGLVESCADPSIIRSQDPADPAWYVFCTKDPLNDDDKNDANEYIYRNIPILRSTDLVNWTYEGTVFDDANFPAYVQPFAGLFAPAIEYFDGTYYLYYSITDTTDPFPNDSAIGVATSDSLLGPWVDSGAPVVEPTEAYCCPGSRRATIDPEVIEVDGQKYMFYGSYFGGISARELSDDGFTTDPTTQVQITIDNRYEAPYIVEYGGYYYLFVSATDCCRGPLTGYSVFAGRSVDPLGPYVDREGVSLLDEELPEEPSDGRLFARVGGTPVLSMNGNQFVGPGHNAVFQDFGGQYWTVYHAVDRFDPYFRDGVDIFPGGCGSEDPPVPEDEPCGDLTKRPLMLDPIDWVDGWPTVRGNFWASNTPQPAPAAQPGQQSAYRTVIKPDDRPGNLRPEFGDEFNSNLLGPGWTWVREPAVDQYAVENGNFRFNTQEGDIYIASNNAPILTRALPGGNYVVETKVSLDMPLDKCPPDCRFIQAGLVIYRDDDNFVKLVDVSIFNTRQTEFAKELAPVQEGYPRYGNTAVSAPGTTTWLRIVKQQAGREELYTAYTSRDGVNYERGGTWTHQLGSYARVGLVSFGGAGYTARFDYVRVSNLAPPYRTMAPIIAR